jgi:hypothetical protein
LHYQERLQDTKGVIQHCKLKKDRNDQNKKEDKKIQQESKQHYTEELAPPTSAPKM